LPLRKENTEYTVKYYKMFGVRKSMETATNSCRNWRYHMYHYARWLL